VHENSRKLFPIWPARQQSSIYSLLYDFVTNKSRYNISYVSSSMSLQFSSRVRCTYKASFTPRRLRAAAPPCDFLSRFGLTPGLWTVYTHINVRTRTYPRTADALARGYAHTPTSVELRFTHAARTLRAIYIERAFLLDTITRPASPRLVDTMIARWYPRVHQYSGT